MQKIAPVGDELDAEAPLVPDGTLVQTQILALGVPVARNLERGARVEIVLDAIARPLGLLAQTVVVCRGLVAIVVITVFVRVDDDVPVAVQALTTAREDILDQMKVGGIHVARVRQKGPTLSQKGDPGGHLISSATARSGFPRAPRFPWTSCEQLEMCCGRNRPLWTTRERPAREASSNAAVANLWTLGPAPGYPPGENRGNGT